MGAFQALTGPALVSTVRAVGKPLSKGQHRFASGLRRDPGFQLFDFKIKVWLDVVPLQLHAFSLRNRNPAQPGKKRSTLISTTGKWCKGRIDSGTCLPRRVIVENGAVPPRFALPVSRPGRPVTNIAINPAADGSFRATLPEGVMWLAAPPDCLRARPCGPCGS